MHVEVTRKTVIPEIVVAERDGSGTWHVGNVLLSEREFVKRYEPLGAWTPAYVPPPERISARTRDLRPASASAARDSHGVWRVAGEPLDEDTFLTLWEPDEGFTPYIAGTTVIGSVLRPWLERTLTWVIERAVSMRSRVALPASAKAPVREKVEDRPIQAPAQVAGEVVAR